MASGYANWILKLFFIRKHRIHVITNSWHGWFTVNDISTYFNITWWNAEFRLRANDNICRETIKCDYLKVIFSPYTNCTYIYTEKGNTLTCAEWLFTSRGYGNVIFIHIWLARAIAIRDSTRIFSLKVEFERFLSIFNDNKFINWEVC